MLVAYRVVEGRYQGLHGIEDIGLFELSGNLSVAEIVRECNEYCSPMVLDLIDSYGLQEDEEDEECYDGGWWVCYKVRDDVKLSEKELDELLCSWGFEMFADEYCIKKDISY